MFFYKKLISQEYFVTLIMYSITKKEFLFALKHFLENQYHLIMWREQN